MSDLSAPNSHGLMASNAKVRKNIGTPAAERDHYYRTPPKCTQALFARESFGPVIWEPSCGDGAIAKVAEANGYRVVASDLIDRGYGEPAQDFLLCQTMAAPDMVINPPFRLADEFVTHAWRLGCSKIAVFQRLAWLEGRARHATIFSVLPLARVWVFCGRQTLWRGDDPEPKEKGGAIPFAWFVFDCDRVGAPAIGWIP